MKIAKTDYKKVMAGEMHLTDAVKEIEDSNVEGYYIVLYNWGSNDMADLNGNFISVPITLSHMDGSVDNEAFDLDKLLERLKADPKVCHKNTLKIESIPFYNGYGERNKTINFKYLMTNTEYENFKRFDRFGRYTYVLDEVIGAKDLRKQRNE